VEGGQPGAARDQVRPAARTQAAEADAATWWLLSGEAPFNDRAFFDISSGR
jgi:hypothetical protein